MTLKPGLYIVATPIGNREDITLRALEILKNCDVIVCEDTRVSQNLLKMYAIHKPLLTYHEHNAKGMRPQILKRLEEQQSIALISDAGMPLISDPGYKLVQSCQERGFFITVLPGPSAVLSGLILSGLPSDRFAFLGFADPARFAEQHALALTLIFFETAKRLLKTLNQMAVIFNHRPIAVVREISKVYEQTIRGDFNAVISYFQQTPPKGEMVIVLGPPLAPSVSADKVDLLLQKALSKLSLRDASDFVAEALGASKKQVYQRALHLIKTPES